MFPVPFTTGPISNPITVNGNTGSLNVEGWASLAVIVNITAITGASPTITFSIDEFDPTSNTYTSLAATSALAATGTTRFTVTQLISQFIRLSWTVSGTSPSVTCTVSAKFRAS